MARNRRRKQRIDSDTAQHKKARRQARTTNLQIEQLEQRQLLAVDCLAGVAVGSSQEEVAAMIATPAEEIAAADLSASAQPIALPVGLPQEFSATVEFQGELLTLQLAKHSIFSENTRFLIDYGGDELVEVNPGVDKSYLGTVDEHANYMVSAVLTPQGLWANIIRPGQTSVTVEPASLGQANVAGSGVGASEQIAHSLYEQEATPSYDDHDHDGDGIPDHAPEDHANEEGGGHPPGCVCPACCSAAAVSDPVSETPYRTLGATAGGGSGDSGSGGAATLPPSRVITVREFEVGVEIGSAALQNNYNYGNNNLTTQQKVDNAMVEAQKIPGNMDARYLHGAGIKHRLGTVIIRTDSDPFTVSNGNDSGGLSAFRSYWNNNSQEVGTTHDLAVYHVRASPSGLAYVNQVGTGSRYALSASNGPSSWADGTLVHEFGHTWSLGHVPGNPTNSFYESRPRGNGNSAGGSDNFISVMHGSGTHNIGRLSSGEANQVYNVSLNKAQFGDVVNDLGPVKPYGRNDLVTASSDPLVIDVIANDYDSNNDVLDVQLRDTVSHQGGTIELSVGTGPGGRNELIYTSPGGTGDDFFHYTVVDSTGRTDWGAVHVTLNGPTTVDLNQTKYLYDVGPIDSPLWPNVDGGSGLFYDRLTDVTFGDIFWNESSNLLPRDRGGSASANDLNRDFIMSPDPVTLNHRVAPGIWNVLITIGDDDFVKDGVQVKAEGGTENGGDTTTGTTAVGQFTNIFLETAVTDGFLTLDFDDIQGSNPDWSMTRLILTRVGDADYEVDLNQTSYSYDFGTGNSPVQEGFVEINQNITGDINWSTTPDSRDRSPQSGISDANVDLVFSSADTTFNHKINNGFWRVTTTMGDATNSHDQMSVNAEGAQVVSPFDTATAQFSEHTFDVEVTDGELSLEFRDNGGTDDNWVLNSVVIEQIEPPTLLGDYNGDNSVDTADYTVWRDTIGTSPPLNFGGADGNGNGIIDQADYGVWRANFGRKITQVALIDATTGNGSFEDWTGATGGILSSTRVLASSSTATLPGWTATTSFTGGWLNTSDGAGTVGAASDGSDYAFVAASATATYTSDSTGHAAAEGEIYTVSLDVGSDNGVAHDYDIRLVFGGNTRTLASFSDGTDVTSGGPSTRTFEYVATAADAGQTPVLEIMLANTGGFSKAFIDNVNLEVVALSPPPAGAGSNVAGGGAGSRAGSRIAAPVATAETLSATTAPAESVVPKTTASSFLYFEPVVQTAAKQAVFESQPQSEASLDYMLLLAADVAEVWQQDDASPSLASDSAEDSEQPADDNLTIDPIL